MKNLTRSLLALLVVSTSLGCCVTGVSTRKVETACQGCLPYDSYPAGVSPAENFDTAPAPIPVPPTPTPVPPSPEVPPAPSSANRGSFKTAMQSLGDSVRDKVWRY